MRLALAASLASLVLLETSSARADLTVAGPAEPPKAAAPSSSAPRPARPWYGWQALIGYAIGDALLAAGAAVQVAHGGSSGIPFFEAGGVARFGAAPLLHLLHKRDKGVIYGSLALQIATPLTGLAIGRVAGPHCYPDNTPACLRGESVAMVVGALAGAVVGSVIDVAVLARGGEPWPARPRAAFGVVPLPIERGFGLGLSGVF